MQEVVCFCNQRWQSINFHHGVQLLVLKLIHTYVQWKYKGMHSRRMLGYVIDVSARAVSG